MDRRLAPRQQADAAEVPAHAEKPEPGRQRAAYRHDADIDGVEYAAPPHHPGGPENGERDRAQFQGCHGIHGAAPLAEMLRPLCRKDRFPAVSWVTKELGAYCLRMIFFRKPVPTFRDHALPNRRRERSLAFSASISR